MAEIICIAYAEGADLEILRLAQDDDDSADVDDNNSADYYWNGKLMM